MCDRIAVRRLGISLVLASIFFSTGVVVASADALSDIKARGKLVCGVLNGYPPYAYVDPKTRQTVGLEIDYCTELAKHLGVAFEPKVITTAGRIPELLQGRVDVLSARIAWTASRAEQVDFSGVYDVATQRFMVRKDSNLKNADIVKGGRLGIPKGTSLDEFLRVNYPDIKPVGYDDDSQAYLAMKIGKVNAILAPETQLLTLKQNDTDGDAVEILPEAILYIRDSIITRKNEPALLDSINDFLNKAEKSGLVQEIFDKYLGANSPFKMKRDFVVGSSPNPK
jgi:polar amino acid transport system substrate-binding protein